MSDPVAYVLGSGIASLLDLQTIYDTEDLLDLMEAALVRDWNAP